VTNFTPRLSPRAEQYEGVRLGFRIRPRSSGGSAFPIESGSDFAIGVRVLRFLRLLLFSGPRSDMHPLFADACGRSVETA
jgi:hypothetical protein